MAILLGSHPSYGTVIVRTRYAEDALAEAVARGTRQCVIIGAGLDAALAVEQRVEERETDRVCLGAGCERAGEAVAGLGELRVGVPPQLARGVIELELSGGLGRV